MSKKILGMGNAVLDILTEAKEEDLTKNNLKKGTMALVEQEDTDININEEEQESQEKHDESIEEDGFNQDPEEELLDIPTFLRRQAN